MIENMKVVYIVTSRSHKKELLDDLRDLGVFHLAQKKSADREMTERFATLSKTELILHDYVQDKKTKGTVLPDDEFEEMYKGVLEAIDTEAVLSQKKSALVTESERVSAWGDFDPAELSEIAKSGLDFHFYRLGKKEYETACADENVKFIRLSSVDKMDTIAALGQLPSSIPANEFRLPEKGLSDIKAEIAECDRQIEACHDTLKKASEYIPSFADQMLKAQNAEEYSAAGHSLESDDNLLWVSGYIPEDDLDKFKNVANEKMWAWAADDPDEDDEKIPTKVRYNKVTRLMSPVFDILGTLPGYREFDISFWFLGFFTLFFAMIIGDAGYGLLFLIGAIAFTVKTKKTNDAILLLYVLSIATIVWGSITGTWFGMESAMQVPFLKALVIPNFANYPQFFGVDASTQQNTIMKFSFMIGAIQISLACILSIKKKLPKKDLSLVADIGWLIAVIALYNMVLYLVIGEEINLVPVATAVGIAFVMVVLFGGMSPDKTFGEGVKACLGNTFTVFLDTISCFGNVMSYIRLFAVGMASLAIAQSFNNMAAGFDGPLVIVGFVIVLIGHALNLVMGLLSVVVHGVRLNLLEFSGQLGMEWTGIAYEPFKKNEKIKK